MSKLGKLRKNAQKFEMDQVYQNMTPEQHKEAVRIAVKNAINDLSREYDKTLEKMRDEYNRVIRDSVMIAMDTLSIELLYALGDKLECYVDEPDHLDQKIDIVQNLYETAMDSIKDYAGTKYKNDNQAQRVFAKKKKTVQKIFGIFTDTEGDTTDADL